SRLPRKAWKTPLQRADATNRTTLRVCDGNTPYHRPSTTQNLADRPDRERQRGLPVPLHPLRRSPSPIKTTNQSQKNQTSLRRNLSQLRLRTGQRLGCRASLLPAGRRLLTSLKCRDPELLREPDDQIEYQTRRGSNLPRDLQ